MIILVFALTVLKVFAFLCNFLTFLCNFERFLIKEGSRHPSTSLVVEGSQRTSSTEVAAHVGVVAVAGEEQEKSSGSSRRGAVVVAGEEQWQ